MDRAIITSASNKFFPSLINLLGSIKKNYPNHPKIYVYDLGLFWSFRKELEQIENVEVITMPHFCPFWRSCYTWKTYILSHPLARLNLYMDAGCQVIKPLQEVFEIIEKQDIFTVGQETALEEIVPKDFINIYNLQELYLKQNCITAGIVGFKKISKVNLATAELLDAGISGMCLGFSQKESWRNTGVNKTDLIRDCNIFRHDTTMVNLIFRKYFGSFEPFSIKKYGGAHSKHEDPEQLIWNLRLNYNELEYMGVFCKTFVAYLNRVFIYAFIFLKRINKTIKNAIS